MRKKGFSLIELLLGSAIMLIVLVATLSIYTRSNRTAVDQHQYADLQNNVRSSMYFLAKDIRSTGVGLLPDIAGYFLEGTDAATPGPEAADCIRLMGNFDDPLNLRVEDYSGGEGGGSATAFLYANAFDQSPYPCPGFYEGRNYLIISTRCPGCYALRNIDTGQVHGCGTGANHVNMNPGASDLNPPGGLLDTGCDAACWTDAIITLGQIKLYWLDTTGDLTSFKEFALTPGVNGYLGQPGVLYLSTTLKDGGITHLPIASNIENIQFQYNGDLDDPPDQQLDGFKNWDNLKWTILDTDTQAEREKAGPHLQDPPGPDVGRRPDREGLRLGVGYPAGRRQSLPPAGYRQQHGGRPGRPPSPVCPGIHFQRTEHVAQPLQLRPTVAAKETAHGLIQRGE